MNFLTIALCLAMGRPYQAYYFVPLISFWFTLQYVALIAPPRVTDPSLVTTKYSISFVLR